MEEERRRRGRKGREKRRRGRRGRGKSKWNREGDEVEEGEGDGVGGWGVERGGGVEKIEGKREVEIWREGG